MNFLFGLIPLAVYVPLMIGGYYLLKRFSAEVIDAGPQQTMLRVYALVSVLVGAMIVVSSFQTFGPRNSLSVNSKTYHPEVSEIEGGAAFTEREEWRDKFEEKIENEPK